MFFRTHVFHGLGFSGSGFFWIQVFQGLGFSGFGFRVRVQGLDPEFRNSLHFVLCFDTYFLWKSNCFPSRWYNFLFWHLYQIHMFHNNLNNEEIIITWCVLKLFYDKKVSTFCNFLWQKYCLREKKQQQINLGKTCCLTKLFRHSKI